MDYGTIAKVHITSLRWLSTEHARLPVQGIRGRLANIVPVNTNGTWSVASSKIFLDMVKEKPILAMLAGFMVSLYSMLYNSASVFASLKAVFSQKRGWISASHAHLVILDTNFEIFST